MYDIGRERRKPGGGVLLSSSGGTRRGCCGWNRTGTRFFDVVVSVWFLFNDAWNGINRDISINLVLSPCKQFIPYFGCRLHRAYAFLPCNLLHVFLFIT